MRNDNGSAADEGIYRYRFGSAEFDEARCELRVDGLAVALEQKPMQVLIRLLRKANEVVTRQEMFDEIWERRPTVEHVLNNAIRKLRQALGSPVGDCIVTVPRRGYMLQVPVHRTFVGRRMASSLALAAGNPVPGRNDFVLESQLAASSGNEVWRARDEAGAVHVFKFSLDGRHLDALKKEVSIFRFLREKLGDREDFVAILRWNFEAAPFYVEMEYGGDNLAAWATGEPGLRGLGGEERIGLFLQIADAVAAAHRLAVLHKDIKPANVLVSRTQDGQLRSSITDFGNGRLLEPDRLEELGFTALNIGITQDAGADLAIGTPLYIAPELLADAAPTVQTDLYALGLLLYQICAGDVRRPMAPGWEADVGDSLVCADIAAATAGDPRRRLGSVAELTNRLRTRDVRRHEESERTLNERRALAAQAELERWRARRPWMVVAAASLIAGSCASLFLYGRAVISQREAVREAHRQLVVNEFLNEMLRGADPSGPDAVRDPTVREMLTHAAERTSIRFADDPVAEAAIQSSLGGAFFGLSEFAKAARHQAEAAKLLTQSRGAADPVTLVAEYATARSLDMDSRHAEAAAILDEADRAAGATLRNNPSLALLAHWTRGGNALMRMLPVVALPEIQTADRIRATAAPHDDVWLIRVRADLAWCYVRLQRPADAIAALQEVMAPAYSPEHVGAFDWAKIHLQYALALMALSRFDEARESLHDTTHQLQKTLGPDHYTVGLAWNYLTAVYQAQGRWDSALDAARNAYAIFRKANGDRDQSTLSALGDIGAIEYLAGRVDAALPTLRSVHETLVQVAGDSGPLTQYVGFYLASALSEIGHPQEARPFAAQLDAVALASVYPSNDWGARLAGLRGQILLQEGPPSRR
jgi:DNA-binding winged helix-turn-helix (wHTH) protein/serine/threonine protein kinase